MDKVKVVKIEDRIPKLKEHRKQKANRRLIFYLSFFFLLLMVVVYFQSDLSHVKKITVSGNYFVTDNEILEKSMVSTKTKYLNVSEDEIVKRLDDITEISSVSIEKKFFNHVVIEVKEFQRVGYFRKDSTYYPMLQNGKMLEPLKKNERPVNAPVIVSWKDPEQLETMAQELQKLPEGIIHRISEITHTPNGNNTNQLTLFMTDGNKVVTAISKFSERLSIYPSLVDKLKPDEKGTFYLGVSTHFERYNRAVTEEKNEQN
ncbi:cell division protein FtsQ/DivIB [Fictibacillus barbaricus]|uniref:Cell division protein DivIB n=1 Tax=Fictibacillus barbaricus TaxID=182136 RepID=A0ABS2ZF22_9BACL|nr:FtsQ-type POTRA domain-containing protein [Fictibacillus barbaricus]MBN3545938.1 FtsQ-type POTRA domain-containing protein [Fictibacillus barbaricus]GGB57273.1 cell division protein DivIB [Fictibacillus barbaricus]